MFRAFVLAIGLATGAQQAAKLSDLTVPADRQPSGCVLSPTPSVHLDGSKVRGGLWAGLPANPWIGTDTVRIASIAMVLDPPTRMPDGPPLNTKEAALFRLQFANGIEESYEAVYLSGDSAPLVIVYGLRFPTASSAQAFLTQSRFSKDPNALQLGSLVALAAGPDGDCLRAVAAYLKGLVG